MQPLRRPSIFGSAGTAPSTLDLFWPTNTSSASGHRASGWGGKGQPHQELDVGLGGAPWPRIDLQLPGTAAVLMIRAALEAADVGLIQASGGVIRGTAADVRGRAEPLSRRGHRRSCGAAGHRPPPRARPGASSRSAPHTGIGRPRRTALSLRRAAMPCLPRWGCCASPAGVSRSGSAAAGRRSHPS